MRCSKCAAENREGRKFCADCGMPLNRRCAACGAENEPTENFCGECGTALVVQVQADLAKSVATTLTARNMRDGPEHPGSDLLEGERKTVTALFADIKGSTELMRDLDPEEARSIIDPALSLMIEAVHRYDGYVVQSTGNGIFALFGAAVAHEDHLQRTLHATLATRDELRRRGKDLRIAGRSGIEVRIGINTGEVVMRPVQTGGTPSTRRWAMRSTWLRGCRASHRQAESLSVKRRRSGAFAVSPDDPQDVALTAIAV